MNDKESKYALYPILKRRTEEDFGIYPIISLTGSGKTSAIGDLYLTEGYDKFTICISNDRKNIQSMYEDHKEYIKKIQIEHPKDDFTNKIDFEEETIMLFSDADMIAEFFAENKKAKDIILDFFTNIYEKPQPASFELNNEIIKTMKSIEGRGKNGNTVQRFKKRMLTHDNKKIKGEKELRFLIENETIDNESKVVREFKAFRKLTSSAINKIINQEFKRLKKEFGVVKKDGVKKSIIKEIIMNKNGEFDWILTFFPQFKLLGIHEDYNKIKRLYMNVSKYISPLNMLVYGETTEPIYHKEIIKNSVIFMDESDKCYDFILNSLIEQSSEIIDFDYLKEMIDLMNKILKSTNINTIAGKERLEKDFEKLKEQIAEIKDKYYKELDYSFKSLSEENINENGLIFYGDYTKKGVVYNNFKFYYNEKNFCYDIVNPAKEKRYKDVIENDNIEIYDLRKLLEDIDKFSWSFVKFIRKQASCIKTKNDEINDEENEYVIDNNKIKSAIEIYVPNGSKIYEYFYEKVDDVIKRIQSKKKLEKLGLDVPKGALYAGFNLFTYKDGDLENQTNTAVNRNALDATPESIMFLSAVDAVVIPMSATQDITTRYHNFIYKMLEKWIRSENYYSLSDEENNTLDGEYDKKTNNYDKLDMKAYIIETNEKRKDKKYKTEADKYFYEVRNSFSLSQEDHDNISKIANISSDDDNYMFERLKSMLYAFKIYLDRDSQHGLFLNTFNINDNSVINKDFIKSIFNNIAKERGIKNIKTYFTNSKNYKDEFEKAEEDYNEGYRTIIVTSYNTLSTGQNTTFALTNENINDRKYIKPNTYNIGNFDRVDADYVYLGPITHLGVRLSETDSGDLRLKYLLQNERAYAMGSITEDSRKINIKYATLNSKKKFVTSYENEFEVYMEILRVIKQTIGRISRNSLKNPTITICASECNIDIAKFKEIEENNLNLKEVLCLFNECKEENIFDDIKLTIPGSDEKHKSFKKHIELITKGNGKNIRNDEEKRLLYESYRTPSMLFPMFKDLKDVPSTLEKYYIKTMKPLKNIYAAPMHNKYCPEHTIKKIRNQCIPIGLDSHIFEISNIPFVKSILEEYEIKIPSKNETFQFFPPMSLFNNIVVGYWAEFIGDELLKKYGFETKALDNIIYEFGDSEIITDKKDAIYIIDYKNWKEYLGIEKASKINAELRKKAERKIEKIKNIEEYSDKQIYFFFINLYNKNNSGDNYNYNKISKKYEIYDFKSLFINKDDSIVLNERIIDWIEKFIY